MEHPNKARLVEHYLMAFNWVKDPANHEEIAKMLKDCQDRLPDSAGYLVCVTLAALLTGKAWISETGELVLV